LGLQEPARVIQQNGDEITIALQSGPTAAFDGGILVATRGFGDDPIAIESRGVPEALRREVAPSHAVSRHWTLKIRFGPRVSVAPSMPLARRASTSVSENSPFAALTRAVVARA
jgi:hypothetical protein